jgi:hypothetical protein
VITNERYSRGHCAGTGKNDVLNFSSCPKLRYQVYGKFSSDLSKVLKEGLESIFYGAF